MSGSRCGWRATPRPVWPGAPARRPSASTSCGTARAISGENPISPPQVSGLRLAVDGAGLARPWAGVGTYTSQLLAAMVAARPEARLTLY
ncbi:MAG: hypothetical protein J2P28_23835, partial [Actinobacteria bacterium]|nr:hypothetical protein [Actinomycetota bacterium]